MGGFIRAVSDIPDKMTMEEWENADFTQPKIKKAN